MRAARALRSILNQAGPVQFEVLLIDFGYAAHVPVPGSLHPLVVTLPVDRTVGYGGAMALGVEQARSPLVAFVEEHVVVQPDWAWKLQEAYHTGQWAALCGEFAVDNPGVGCADLVDLFAFGPWSAPAQAGAATRLRWGNSTFRRAVLLQQREHLAQLFNGDSALYEYLKREGLTVGVAPAVRARHANEVRVRDFLRGAFLSNRLSVATRTAYLHLTWGQRVVRALAATLGPLRSTRRLLATARQAGHRPDLLPLAEHHRGVVIVHYALVAAGTIAGLLFGPGGAEQGYLDYVLNLRRGLPEDQ
jgi:glycosyltransferase involved in cell wall biosynthesis